MKAAASLTSQVMEAVCRLPGVATIDWCDRAAAALCRVHHPGHAFVALVTLDSRGFVMEVETTGSASSLSRPPTAQDVFVQIDERRAQLATGGQEATPTAPASTPAGTATLASPRQDARPGRPAAASPGDGLKKGDWIGWTIGALQDGLWHVSMGSQAGLLGAASQGPLARRWASKNPAEVILLAASIPGLRSGRWLIAEVAVSGGKDVVLDREEAALAACLPMLAQRLYAAFGREPVNLHASLTPREEAVLWRLVAGKKVPEIAEELSRSTYTVHDHVKSLHRKLGAKSRGELVARALGHLTANTDLPHDDHGK